MASIATEKLNKVLHIVEEVWNNLDYVKLVDRWNNLEPNWDIEPPLLVAYFVVVLMALVPIWLGSHLALKQRSVETMTSRDAWMFPVMGSGILFGLYLLFRIFSKEYINMLLTAYFMILGVTAITNLFSSFFASFASKAAQKRFKKISFSLPFSKEPVEWKITKFDIYGLLIGLPVCVVYLINKHWIANNIIGLSFSIQAISLLSVGSFKKGCVLLVGLFFYDIFWVFGTDVMVTVAKSFEAPIKVVFPRDVFAETFQFSMLGLGDIVIPGVFVALMLRFDKSKARKGHHIVKNYFLVCFLAYICGLVNTIVVMHVLRSAQPALLYLVPYCVLSVILFALLRGEILQLFSYSEDVAATQANQKSAPGTGKRAQSNNVTKKSKTN